MLEDRLYFRLIRKWVEECLNEAQSDFPAFADNFQRRDVDIVSADLAVAELVLRSDSDSDG